MSREILSRIVVAWCHEISFSFLFPFYTLHFTTILQFVSIYYNADKCYFYSLESSVASLSVNELL